MIHEAVPFDDLISLLLEEAAIYRQMSALLAEEREALLSMAASDLAEICARKETLALRVKALDESRKLLSDRLGRRFGIAPADLTVSTLCRLAPKPVAERLDAARKELRELALECKNLNEANSRAARRGVDLITSAVEFLLADPDPAGRVYQKKGGYGAPARRSPEVVSHQA